MLNSIINIQISEAANPTEPVGLSDSKLQAIVDHANDNDYITSLIKKCRQEFESICGISIVEKNIVLIADWNREQQLPYPPIKGINDVKIKTGVATGGSAEYETPSCYSIDGGFFDLSSCNRLKITYTTGMTTVPEDLKLALLNLIAFRYANRGDHSVELTDDVKSQILKFKDYSWS